MRWVRRLRAEGVPTAVVSSSANARAVLRAAGIDGLFDLTVDGGDVARLGLRGKPAPDGFLEAAGRLGVLPHAAIVVEDAVAGVAAGRAGGFGLVLGVARTAAPEALPPRAPTWSSTTSRRWSDEATGASPSARTTPAGRPALESVFAVGNGYLGVRGAPDEGTPAHDPGVILNGFHETWPIVYPEDAYGLARTGQTIVGATDGSIVRLFVDDEPFDLASARLLAFERTLDMRTGVLSRELEFETARGGRIRIRSRRLASLADRHLLAIDYEVEALDGPARIAIASELLTHPPGAGADDPRRGKGFAEQVLRPLQARAAGTRAALRLATASSGLELACGMEHRVDAPGPVALESAAEDDRAELMVLADLPAGAPLRLFKSVAYHWAPQDRPAACSRASIARSTVPRPPATRASSATTPPRWPASGAAATSRSTARPTSSRPCASTCSRCCRRPRAARATGSRRRA